MCIWLQGAGVSESKAAGDGAGDLAAEVEATEEENINGGKSDAESSIVRGSDTEVGRTKSQQRKVKKGVAQGALPPRVTRAMQAPTLVDHSARLVLFSVSTDGCTCLI